MCVYLCVSRQLTHSVLLGCWCYRKDAATTRYKIILAAKVKTDVQLVCRECVFALCVTCVWLSNVCVCRLCVYVNVCLHVCECIVPVCVRTGCVSLVWHVWRICCVCVTYVRVLCVWVMYVCLAYVTRVPYMWLTCVHVCEVCLYLCVCRVFDLSFHVADKCKTYSRRPAHCPMFISFATEVKMVWRLWFMFMIWYEGGCVWCDDVYWCVCVWHVMCGCDLDKWVFWHVWVTCACVKCVCMTCVTCAWRVYLYDVCSMCVKYVCVYVTCVWLEYDVFLCDCWVSFPFLCVGAWPVFDVCVWGVWSVFKIYYERIWLPPSNDSDCSQVTGLSFFFVFMDVICLWYDICCV